MVTHGYYKILGNTWILHNTYGYYMCVNTAYVMESFVVIRCKLCDKSINYFNLGLQSILHFYIISYNNKIYIIIYQIILFITFNSISYNML